MTTVELELELLVGEMPDIPCEGPDHATDTFEHDEGPARHYFRLAHDCVAGSAGTIIARCERKAATLRKVLTRPWPVFCTGCGTTFRNGSKWLQYVGPVENK